MKKRVVSCLLALALALSIVPSSLAAGTFSDVTDEETARNAEVLRLMGIIEGDGDGTFRPDGTLTRAEFCKMALVLQGRVEKAAGYRNRTVFPDVRGTHWAAGYINYATTSTDEKTASLMHGFPDGTFRPDKTISYGEAVTVLTRALGYTDNDTGGIWPDGYLAVADAAGMTKGLSLGGDSTLTRAQAARLFVNALTATNDDVTLLEKLGYSVSLEEDPVTLYSVDAANGKLRTSAETTPDVVMAKPMESTALNGLKGHVVYKDKKAVTFLPVTSNTGGVLSDGAVIVMSNGSTAGFGALTGNANNCAIVKNGVTITADELKANDVATYNASNNTVQVSDTRIQVYYEDCYPSQTEPETITVLGGMKFSVLPSARPSLAEIRPGRTMVIYLTADGRVAGAKERGTSNALACVDSAGSVQLLCGGSLISLSASAANYANKVVLVAQDKDGVHFAEQSVSADVVDAAAMKMGSRTIRSDALVVVDGKVSSLASLNTTVVERSSVAYYRLDAKNQVSLLVIGGVSGVYYYGRAVVTAESDGAGYTVYLDCKNRKSPSLLTGRRFTDGEYLEFRCSKDGKRVEDSEPLTKLANVPASAWLDDTTVTYGSKTYAVYPRSLLCYNADTNKWFEATASDKTALDAAREYGAKMDLYVKDGVVRVVEVHTK